MEWVNDNSQHLKQSSYKSIFSKYNIVNGLCVENVQVSVKNIRSEMEVNVHSRWVFRVA